MPMYEQINEGCAPFCFMFFSFQIESFSASVFLTSLVFRTRSPSALRCSSLLLLHYVSDAGAAHRHEAGLQPVDVAVPRPRRLEPPQQQHLVHYGPGLQAAVLLALGVQAALQQTASLRQDPGEEIVVVGDVVRPRRDGGVLERYDVCGRNQSAGVQLQGDRFYRGGAGVRLPVCPP